MPLELIKTQQQDAPYPASTRAKGWRLELDLDAIHRSPGWCLAPAEMRPWMLMMFAISWAESPCGTLPPDDRLIAAKIGMEFEMFTGYRSILLADWVQHKDGLLYNNLVSERVLSMISVRHSDALRQAAFRAKSNR